MAEQQVVMQQDRPTENVMLGDLYQRVSKQIYMHLSQLIVSMRDLDPELRTDYLVKFIKRSKKLLSQLYALTNWLGQSRVQMMFRNMDSFYFRLFETNELFNQALHQIFIIHSSLYSMKTIKFETKTALQILSNKTYPLLPQAIFNCGTKSFPDIAKEGLDEIVLSKLTLYIRTKLALKDRLPKHRFLNYRLEDGVLIIVNQYYYSLFLTLNSLNVNSTWKILGFKLEESVQAKLSNKSQHHNSRRNKQTELDVLKHLLTHTKQNNFKLKDIIGYCEYVVTSVRMRHNYLKLLRFSRQELFRDQFEVKFLEKGREAEINLRFWKSVGQEFQFGLTWKLMEVDDSTVIPRIKSTYEIVPISTTIPQLTCEYDFEQLIALNTAAEVIFSNLSSWFISRKLLFLYIRILITDQVKPFKVTLSGSHISLAMTDSLVVSLRVDARSGRYVLSTSSIGELTGCCRSSINRFLDEINDLGSEHMFFRSLIEDGFFDSVLNNPLNCNIQQLVSTYQDTHKEWFRPLTTLSILVNCFYLVASCKSFANISGFISFATEEERQHIAAASNLQFAFVLIRVGYWISNNLYRGKTQLLVHELKAHVKEKSKTPITSTTSNANSNQPKQDPSKRNLTKANSGNDVNKNGLSTTANQSAANSSLLKETLVLYLLYSVDEKGVITPWFLLAKHSLPVGGKRLRVDLVKKVNPLEPENGFTSLSLTCCLNPYKVFRSSMDWAKGLLKVEFETVSLKLFFDDFLSTTKLSAGDNLWLGKRLSDGRYCIREGETEFFTLLYQCDLITVDVFSSGKFAATLGAVKNYSDSDIVESVASVTAHLASIKLRFHTVCSSSQSSSTNRDTSIVKLLVEEYCHFYQGDVQSQISVLITAYAMQFLDLLLKKIEIKGNIEQKLLDLVSTMRALSVFLWIILAYESTMNNIRDVLLLPVSLRPLQVSVSSDDSPVILLAIDHLNHTEPLVPQLMKFRTFELTVKNGDILKVFNFKDISNNIKASLTFDQVNFENIQKIFELIYGSQSQQR